MRMIKGLYLKKTFEDSVDALIGWLSFSLSSACCNFVFHLLQTIDTLQQYPSLSNEKSNDVFVPENGIFSAGF
ncbi:hypothetical protein Peur_022998 [Populus x canadensis]